MKRYEYMVVYNFENGIGRMQITSKKLVERYEDVENFDKTIRKYKGFKNAFVTDFKLLREYDVSE